VAGKQFISEIRDRDRVSGIFLVQQKTVLLNKNGKPYIALTLMDRTGSMEGRVWDNVDQFEGMFEAGDYLDIAAQAVAYQGRVQLKIERLSAREPDSVNPDEFLPATRRDRGEMLARVRELLQGIREAALRKFCLACLDDERFRERFARAPAAKNIHHAFLGGLLEHTLSVMELCDRLCPLYPELDRDLLLAGAFFHDAGKVRELGRDRSFEYTDEGRLLGHIVVGAQMLADWNRDFALLSPEQLLSLQHMVVAHHGSTEFGSPKLPMFAEALALNYLDDLDSKLESFREIAEREGGQRWSSFQKPLDRYLFLGVQKNGREAAAAEREPPSAEEKAGPLRVPSENARAVEDQSGAPPRASLELFPPPGRKRGDRS
jgi:3'-5' exoribonuclease